jgi:hypothetical protein
MSAEVLSFPGRLASSPPPARIAVPIFRPRREYRFAEIVRLLSLSGQQRTIIDFLRDLHLQCGMPLPKNPRRWRGQVQHGAQAIDSRSRWCALEFDAWFDSRRGPPSGGAALAAEDGVPPLPAAARADMADRARMLAAR